jgi:hypothetical protein
MKSKILRRNVSGSLVVPIFKKILASDCEALTDFDVYSCTKSLDTTNKKNGSSSIQLVKTADAANYFVATITFAKDFTKYKNLIFSFYSANASNLDSIGIVLFTSTPFDYGSCYTKYVAGFQNGWNTFKNPIVESATDFVLTGTNEFDKVEGLRFVVNIAVDNATETVNFDNIYANY